MLRIHFIRRSARRVLILGAFTLQGIVAQADSASEVAAKPVNAVDSAQESRRLALAGKFDDAEQQIERARVPESVGAEQKDLIVAFELWAMAQEASNEARMLEAGQLAARAKKRLEKAAAFARTQADVARIARLRLELAEQFPDDDKELDARRADCERESASAERQVIAGGESK